MVKCLPTTWETGVQSLGQEDALEKETATHSSILAWEILWREKSGGLWFMGSQIIRQQLGTRTHAHTHTHTHTHISGIIQGQEESKLRLMAAC